MNYDDTKIDDGEGTYADGPVTELTGITAYGRMQGLRDGHSHTNGKVIKPFKSTYGKKELFISNELVSISRTTVDEHEVYTVTGVGFDHKKQTFGMKVATFELERLYNYVKLTGDLVEIRASKPRTYKTMFIAKGKFKDLNGIEIPKHSILSKTVVIQGNGITDGKIEVEGIPDAIVDDEKLSMFCTVFQPQIEITESE